MKANLLIVVILCLCSSAVFADMRPCEPVPISHYSESNLSRKQQKRAWRAMRRIYRNGIPYDANGMAHIRETRFNWIPFLPPFGANLVGGNAVAFRVDEHHQLYSPRFTKIFGGGIDAGLGVGFPFSVGFTNEIRSFRNREYEDFTERRHLQTSIQGFAAAGAAPFIRVKSFGLHHGSFPGRVESSRTLFFGLFARIGISADFKTMRPHKTRR